MKILKTKSWQHVTTGVDGKCELFSVSIFNYEWDSTGEKIKVKDPLYKQDHIAHVYRVSIDGNIQTFAACEFSNCVWGFYLYKY